MWFKLVILITKTKLNVFVQKPIMKIHKLVQIAYLIVCNCCISAQNYEKYCYQSNDNDYRFCGGFMGECCQIKYRTNCGHAIKIICTDRYFERIVCSGSIVNNGNLVVTAKHCFENVTDLSACTIETNPSWGHGWGQAEEVTRITLGENILEKSFDDITILQLPFSIISTDEIIRLPDASVDVSHNSLADKKLTFCSWGRVSETEFSPEVKCMPFTILTYDSCNCSYPFSFCAGVNIGHGISCEGDSGGGLFMEDFDGQNYLIGVLSTGPNISCTWDACDNYEIGNSFVNVSSIVHHPHVYEFLKKTETTVGRCSTPDGIRSGNFLSYYFLPLQLFVALGLPGSACNYLF